mmetsp:Transcript_52567/g.90437  ORF Transcript_52567/g.90437 Transcript_52567/m.90437 type:complete len:201 (-) Transcript_52567:1972-2574(-)
MIYYAETTEPCRSESRQSAHIYDKLPLLFSFLFSTYRTEETHGNDGYVQAAAISKHISLVAVDAKRQWEKPYAANAAHPCGRPLLPSRRRRRGRRGRRRLQQRLHGLRPGLPERADQEREPDQPAALQGPPPLPGGRPARGVQLPTSAAFCEDRKPAPPLSLLNKREPHQAGRLSHVWPHSPLQGVRGRRMASARGRPVH